MSAPVGVVTLAERHPEPPNSGEDWYEAMVAKKYEEGKALPVSW